MGEPKHDSDVNKAINAKSVCAALDEMTEKVKSHNRSRVTKKESSKPKKSTSNIK